MARVYGARHREASAPDALGLTPCAWPPGTSTPSAPASTASSTSRCASTSTCSRCRRSSARSSSSRSSAFEDAGFHVEAHGFSQWNGVAIASREPLTDVRTAFPGMPGFAKGHEGPDAPLEARAIGATVGGVEVWSLYVPERALARRSALLLQARLARGARGVHARHAGARTPTSPLALVGDFNIAPTDADNGDPTVVAGVLDARVPARARGVRGARGGRASGRRASARADRLHLLGLQAPALPAQRGHAHRLHPRLARAGRCRGRAHRSTATSARARRRATTCRSSSTSTSTGPDDDDRPMIF